MVRILVIDDATEARRFVRFALQSAGHEVLEAAEGGEGLRIFLEEGPDLVICDIFMPGKDGLETIRAMLASRHDLPMIVISGGGASGDMDFLRFASLFGARRTLSKPFAVQELLAAVDECLDAPLRGD